MTKLSRDSLEFAKNHIAKFYDSDCFPKPFEYYALWDNWDEVFLYLTRHDLTEYPVSRPVRREMAIQPHNHAGRFISSSNRATYKSRSALCPFLSDW